MAVWTKAKRAEASDLKSEVLEGAIPFTATIYTPEAHIDEHPAFNRTVVGANPTGSTNFGGRAARAERRKPRKSVA